MRQADIIQLGAGGLANGPLFRGLARPAQAAAEEVPARPAVAAHHDVLQDVHLQEQAGILERAGDAGAGDLVGLQTGDGLVLEGDLARVSGLSRPEIMLNRVVLPAPLGPMTPLIWPAVTLSDTPSTATSPPKLRADALDFKQRSLPSCWTPSCRTGHAPGPEARFEAPLLPKLPLSLPTHPFKALSGPSGAREMIRIRIAPKTALS